MKVDTSSRHSETGMGGKARAKEQTPTSIIEILWKEKVDSQKQRHGSRFVTRDLGVVIVFRESSKHGVVIHTVRMK